MNTHKQFADRIKSPLDHNYKTKKQPKREQSAFLRKYEDLKKPIERHVEKVISEAKVKNQIDWGSPDFSHV